MELKEEIISEQHQLKGMPKLYNQSQTFAPIINQTCYIHAGIPSISLQLNACDAGFHCPFVETQASICLPTLECSVQRLLGFQCLAQGPFEPMLCLPGYYCPTVGSQTQMITCPEGFYCPSGTSIPNPCSPLASCPEGTIMQQDRTGLILCGILDGLLILLFYGLKAKQLRLEGKSLASLLPNLLRKLVSKSSTCPSKPPTIIESESSPVDLLVDAWKKGLGSASTGLNFRFEELGLTLPDGKVVLSGVSGEIKSSRMTAIMGPSGAGKTTFMNVLCGKVNRTKGKLFVNNVEAEMPSYRNIVGFVPQEDTMLRELTVRQNIRYSAKTRLPFTWTDQEIDEFVDNLLVALNLQGVAHSPIGTEFERGVSGGQRKRVNIGLEMASVPICLFLDEPTSGLDSTASLAVADILHQVTALGLTVVSVIHQPRIEIFKRFHDVLIILPGGRTAYLGPTSEAKRYFEGLGFIFDSSVNEADVLMDIMSGKGINPTKSFSPNDFVEAWIKHSSLKPTENVKSSVNAADQEGQLKAIVSQRGAPFWKQVILSHNRSLAQQQKSVAAIALEIFVGCFAGLLMGIASRQDEMFSTVYIQPYLTLSPSGFEFLVPLFSLLIGMSVSLAAAPSGVKVFSEEKAVYWREASVGHFPLAYYLGKTISTLYRVALSSLHFTAVYHFLAKPIIPFNHAYFVVFLTFYGVYGLASIVSMIVVRDNAPLMSAIFCLFTSVFCGYGPSLTQAKEWGVLFIWELSYNKWAAEALYSESVMPYNDVYILEVGNAQYGYTLNRYWFDVGIMFLIGTLLRFVSFGLLVGLNRDKQK